MILRHFAHNLREQNWTAISIEFVLLVVGVFLGIQVANWNESRNDAQRAQENLERIASDLESDRGSLQRRVVFWREVADHGRVAIRYAETGEKREGSAWQTLLSFYQASQLFPYVPMDTTYRELVSAGELGLFRSADLRTALRACAAYSRALVPDHHGTGTVLLNGAGGTLTLSGDNSYSGSTTMGAGGATPAPATT